MCTRRAPALLHARAESSHLTHIVWWLKGSARRAPATAPALRAVSLCLCVRDVAVSGSSTWRVDRVSWSTMASTARMVPKPSSLGSHQRASIEFILYRRWRMDDCAGDGVSAAARRRSGSSAAAAAWHGRRWAGCHAQVGRASRWPGQRRLLPRTRVVVSERFVPGFGRTRGGTSHTQGFHNAQVPAMARSEGGISCAVC